MKIFSAWLSKTSAIIFTHCQETLKAKKKFIVSPTVSMASN